MGLESESPEGAAEKPKFDEQPSVLQKLQKWGDYDACGKAVSPTKFIPMKTPLGSEILESWNLQSPPRDPLSIPILQQHQRQLGERIGMIIDLSNHDSLYAADLKDTEIQYARVPLVAKIFPEQNAVNKVVEKADNFWGEFPNMYIGIHCAYGYNRTGFVLCSYLVQVCNFTVEEALESFALARPPGIRQAFDSYPLRKGSSARHQRGPGFGNGSAEAVSGFPQKQSMNLFPRFEIVIVTGRFNNNFCLPYFLAKHCRHEQFVSELQRRYTGPKSGPMQQSSSFSELRGFGRFGERQRVDSLQSDFLGVAEHLHDHHPSLGQRVSEASEASGSHAGSLVRDAQDEVVLGSSPTIELSERPSAKGRGLLIGNSARSLQTSQSGSINNESLDLDERDIYQHFARRRDLPTEGIANGHHRRPPLRQALPTIGSDPPSFPSCEKASMNEDSALVGPCPQRRECPRGCASPSREPEESECLDPQQLTSLGPEDAKVHLGGLSQRIEHPCDEGPLSETEGEPRRRLCTLM